MDPDAADEGAFLEVTDVDEILEFSDNDIDDAADEIGDMDFDENEMDGSETENGDNPRSSKEDANLIFTEHSGEVFALAIDQNNGSLCVSGGEDDRAFVWSLQDGRVLFECTGHTESVVAVDFNNSSSLVATGDMNGLVKVWDVANGKEIWSFEVSEIQWLKWHPAGPMLLAGTIDGDVWLWKVPTGETRTFPGHGSVCGVGDFLPDGKRACVGYKDGSIRIWDLHTAAALHTLHPGPNNHTNSVNCIAIHKTKSQILSGSVDSSALLINADNGQVLARYVHTDRNNDEAAGEDDINDGVETVAFSSSQDTLANFVATGTLSGLLTIWNTTTHTHRHQCRLPDGIVRLLWHPHLPRVIAACLDGTVSVWDARDGNQLALLHGGTAEIYDMNFSRDGKIVVTACNDQKVRAFNISTIT